jgi:hypothetical protein
VNIFPDIPGIPKLEEAPLTYSYEYINGAAELYLLYGFQTVLVQEYETPQEQVVTIEIYRHDTPYDAFGIYSQERHRESHFLDIGAQGYYEDGWLNFVKGCYYVVMRSYGFEEAAEALLTPAAQQIAHELDGSSELPEILVYFPDKGRIPHSEQFIPQGFLGYPFFNSVFTADYELPEHTFTLFFIKGKDQQDCEAMLSAYLAALNAEEAGLEEGHHTFDDPYHGEISLTWRGNLMWGITGSDDPKHTARVFATHGGSVSSASKTVMPRSTLPHFHNPKL